MDLAPGQPLLAPNTPRQCPYRPRFAAGSSGVMAAATPYWPREGGIDRGSVRDVGADDVVAPPPVVR